MCGPSWMRSVQREQQSSACPRVDPMSIVFAATYPQRTSALIVWVICSMSLGTRRCMGQDRRLARGRLENERRNLGQGNTIDRFIPSLPGDQELRKLVGRTERASASPEAGLAMIRMNHGID